ncbi:HNH endonuclease [Terriglobus aquaticus]|uniref:HNH endonuclease n=1 Tax=Terriglobus aquaticus TaxID=940139 RepID=A0ABW9KF97_9BACT|nr:HNH endonuclease [Terriglobus aquaticus]
MKGRIKRKQEWAEAEAQAARVAEPEPVCALCGRPLGARVEWHHRVPKSEGGTEMVPVHPICHRTIHAHVSNHDLATVYADLDALRGREDIQRFLRWIAKKPENFNAPTRRARVE